MTDKAPEDTEGSHTSAVGSVPAVEEALRCLSPLMSYAEDSTSIAERNEKTPVAAQSAVEPAAVEERAGQALKQ